MTPNAINETCLYLGIPEGTQSADVVNEYHRINHAMNRAGKGGELQLPLVALCCEIVQLKRELAAIRGAIGEDQLPAPPPAPAQHLPNQAFTDSGIDWGCVPQDTIVVVKHEGEEKLGRFRRRGPGGRLRVDPASMQESNWPHFDVEDVTPANDEQVEQYKELTAVG